MADPAAVDASPLIILARGGWLGVLRIAGDPIVVPAAVATEIRQGDVADAAVLALRTEAWLTVVEVEPRSAGAMRALALDEGEAAVLAWALAHEGTLAVLDDLEARRAARRLDVPVTGTLGLIVEAKRRGIIPAARPVVEHLLRSTDWYLSDAVRDRAMASIGE